MSHKPWLDMYPLSLGQGCEGLLGTRGPHHQRKMRFCPAPGATFW